MAKSVDNHSNQGGGYDGGDPDAEIARLAAEDAARAQRAADDAKRAAERDRNNRGGR